MVLSSPIQPPKTVAAPPDWRRWAAVLIPGLILYFAPLPGLDPQQRHLLAIFAATIISLVAQPVPMGVSVFLAITVLAWTKTLPPVRVLSGFSNTTAWLIFAAFLFARAVTVTGFGMRVAYMFVRRFARSPLSLGYSVVAADVVLAPFVPSDTARGGGIIYPIVRSLATAFDSEPGPTANRIGSFLMLVGFHATYTASAMFLTGMAANPLIADFALKIAHVELTWLKWALASSVPGLLSLICVPWIIYKLYPPEVRDTEPARAIASALLAKMGPVSREERWLMLIMVCVMVGWVTLPLFGLPSAFNAFVALAGISVMLVARVLTWADLLAEHKAWDALIWFGSMLMMAEALTDLGVIKILSAAAFRYIHGWPWPVAILVLTVLYLYVHYGFASMTAHVTTLYPGFLAAAISGSVPPMLAALAFAFFSNLNASITHYGTGSAPVYFGAGFVSQGAWWKLGFVVSLVNLVFWLGIGSLWWKLTGLW